MELPLEIYISTSMDVLSKNNQTRYIFYVMCWVWNIYGRISIKSAARLSLTSAYWQEVSADRQCCTQARNAMMANAAATVLINSNKSLLFDELQAVEDEDDDILMA